MIGNLNAVKLYTQFWPIVPTCLLVSTSPVTVGIWITTTMIRTLVETEADDAQDAGDITPNKRHLFILSMANRALPLNVTMSRRAWRVRWKVRTIFSKDEGWTWSLRMTVEGSSTWRAKVMCHLTTPSMYVQMYRLLYLYLYSKFSASFCLHGVASFSIFTNNVLNQCENVSNDFYCG